MEQNPIIKQHTVIGGGGTKLYVEETGNPMGRPLFFVHGYCQSGAVWTLQTNSDLKDDFRIITMDVRGHGLSEKPRDAYGDSKLWAEDIQAVIETLGLEKPVLIGWSYGGIVIFDFLRYFGNENIGGVNLVGARSRIGTPEAVVETGNEYITFKNSLFSRDFTENVEASEKFIKLCTYRELSPSAFYFFLGFNVKVPPYVREGLMSRVITNDDLLSTIEKPVLITHGREDQIVLLRHAEYNASKLKNVKTSYYEGVGHIPFYEKSERFNQELRDFAYSLD